MDGDGSPDDAHEALAGFSEATRAWFTGAFDRPTEAQAGAWRVVRGGGHALVVAPTGSGKTLAAFLWALDRLATTPPPADRRHRCRVLYVSPLKALAVDVERNLRAPLAGMRQASTRLGLPEPDVAVGIRSGDTPADARRQMARHPPDVLITTPESLFLLLTSQARESLRGVDTVVVDEVHAVAGTKRGAHLALSLERLDALLDRPAQRIGLSATVRPVDEVARFLGGAAPVEAVQPPSEKRVDLSVVVPVEDMGELGQPTGEYDGSASGAEERTSIWPHVEERLVDLIEEHRSTIVFANSRRLAERLTARLNEVAYERRTGEELETGGAPAATMAQAGASGGAPEVVARAHHGSVSKEQRALVEEDLKAGRLPAVVATSSLELGIDMGAVDLVVQVESPPSVASGLQRVGRAGHQVGAVSRGVVFPKYRGDLVQTAVVAERMRHGQIEALRVPANPLDVLAQHAVSMCAMDEWDVDALGALVRRAASFSSLPGSALESVLDMLAGRYPSDEFAELRPRLVWDRVAGTVSGRPGAQRLAVTSGGTIPDRGLFGVFLVSGSGEPSRRVGELDEEMVYESRVGDVFTLGTSSWRIEDITHDRVVVSPSPGQPGRLPFWKGDAPGRPVELGRAVGGFVRELAALDDEAAEAHVRAYGLDAWAAGNLVGYLREQREATQHLPDDRTVVVERFRDELGDWRVVVHSPFGARVHAPWALAMGARLRERFGVDVQAMHADDGIVLRLPDTEDEPPPDLAVFEPDEVEQLVTDEVGGSALFASRFRECAARALLLPKRDPRRRTPLWQQRQRSAQLLSVASQYGSFPVVLETMRECLQDVFDVPGLVGLMRDVEARRVRLVEVVTPEPSPFARSLLFGYVAQFLYEGDSPLAERRAAALALDSRLLAELLGQADLRELLDADAVAEVERELQWLTEERRVKDVEGAADLLRVLGPLSGAEAAERGADPAWMRELGEARRAILVRVGGEDRWAAVEDAGRLRDALGVPLPVGVPEAFTEPVTDPLGDLVSRYARTHGPFTAAAAAARLGLGVAVVTGALQRLATAGRATSGEFRPGGSGTEWCDPEVLRRLRRRSLAALRQEAEPVPATALARFLPAWQHVTPATTPSSGAGRPSSGAAPQRRPDGLRGVDGLVRAVEQLQGAPVPASALERLVLPARVTDYAPAMLDELTSSGEVVWAGTGPLPGNDGWVTLALADTADLLLPEPDVDLALTPLHAALLEALDGDVALFFRALSDRAATAREAGGEAGGDAGGHGGAGRGEAAGSAAGPVDDQALVAALWDLVWAGHVTNDTLAPLRTLLAAGRTAHRGRTAPTRARRGRGRAGRGGLPGRSTLPGRSGRPAMPSRTGPPTAAGRWSLLPERDPDPTHRAHARAEAMLDRHGVLTRGAVAAEQVPGGFAATYRVLSAFEDAGRARRGYYVEGLGAAQFATPGAVDRLRATAQQARGEADSPPGDGFGRDTGGGARDRAAGSTLVLAATDPANPYGAALPWPTRPGEAGGHRPGRKAGALVVLVRGHLVLYVERGGRTLLSLTDDDTLLEPAVQALASAVTGGALGRLTVERADGERALDTPLGRALERAGFHATPRGLRLRP